MRKRTVAIVVLVIVAPIALGTRMPARAQGAAGPATRPVALEDRVAQLEAKLDDAVRRLDALQRKVSRLGDLPDVVAAAPPATVPAARAGADDRFAGRWAGSYRNNRGAKGATALSLAVADGRATGTWDKVPVVGPQVGPDLLQLRGDSADRVYQMTVELDGEAMTIKYVVTLKGKNGSYSGTAELTRDK